MMTITERISVMKLSSSNTESTKAEPDSTLNDTIWDAMFNIYPPYSTSKTNPGYDEVRVHVSANKKEYLKALSRNSDELKILKASKGSVSNVEIKKINSQLEERLGDLYTDCVRIYKLSKQYPVRK